MQCLEVNGAVRLIYRSLGVKGLTRITFSALLIKQTVRLYRFMERYSTLKRENLVALRRGSCDSRRETGSGSFPHLRQQTHSSWQVWRLFGSNDATCWVHNRIKLV